MDKDVDRDFEDLAMDGADERSTNSEDIDSFSDSDFSIYRIDLTDDVEVDMEKF